jgi:hypothetical protein
MSRSIQAVDNFRLDGVMLRPHGVRVICKTLMARSRGGISFFLSYAARRIASLQLVYKLRSCDFSKLKIVSSAMPRVRAR